MPADFPLRGEVYWVEVPGLGRKPFVVVSNNKRNRNLDDVVAARITTVPHPPLESIVPLREFGSPIAGWVLCDDLTSISKAELAEHFGALSPHAMMAVTHGLRVALGLE
jgi:mRNA interferase MazF